jgi:Fe-S-cluster containining protein
MAKTRMARQDTDDFGPLAFFKAQEKAFSETLRERQGSENLVDGLLTQAYSSFDRNVEIQAEGMPELACRKGCATCCTLRVTATAPEVLIIGRYVRWSADQLKALNIDLAERIAAANEKTRGLDEQQRVALRLRCPYIHSGVCLIYQVRPLACRGHASYDVRACVEAAAGRSDEVPYSAPHMTVRGLVQNAMQSALRDAGLAFGLYELNQAVCLALQDEACCQAWLSGVDVFGPAAVNELSTEEMAHTYDAIHAL